MQKQHTVKRSGTKQMSRLLNDIICLHFSLKKVLEIQSGPQNTWDPESDDELFSQQLLSTDYRCAHLVLQPSVSSPVMMPFRLPARRMLCAGLCAASLLALLIHYLAAPDVLLTVNALVSGAQWIFFTQPGWVRIHFLSLWPFSAAPRAAERFSKTSPSTAVGG